MSRPAKSTSRKLIDFARGWDRAAPLVVHCYAGISRSTAGAFVAACALNPGRAELRIAQELRRRSDTASPNRRIVSIADDACWAATAAWSTRSTPSGAARVAYEAVPFRLELE